MVDGSVCSRHLPFLVIQEKENRMQISLLTIHHMGEKKMKEKI